MKNYSIEKVGSEYVVKVDDQQVMKLGSRRRAAQLVVDAAGLLDEVPLAPEQACPSDKAVAEDISLAADVDPIESGDIAPSNTCDSPEVA